MAVSVLRAGMIALLAALAGTAGAAGFDKPIVSVAWLQSQANPGDLLVLDASPTPMHQAGHIPGAVPADAMGLLMPGVSATAVAQKLRAWGVSPGRKVLIYDQGGAYFAPRLYYDLYRLGVPAADMAILDGGLAKWRAVGGAVTQERTPAPTPGTFATAKERDEVTVDLPRFVAATADPAHQVTVDALPASYHFGAAKFFGKAGHIPNSVSWPAEDFFNEDKTFKSPAEIRRVAAHLGITPDRAVHSHCGGGGAAAVPFFALKFVAGYPQVTLFPGSQREWQRDDRGLPFWTYSAPMLMRDADWVAGWNGRMLRTFGASGLNIVDVRPAATYAQGHLPYAVNVPAADIAARLHQPEQLARLLGRAGVNAGDEAVIVSGGGLNEDAALAFMALERAGQRQVSLLMESVDDWQLRGLEITKQPTVVGAPGSPRDMAVPAVEYPLASRPAPAAPAEGIPTLYVATGKAAPAKAPAGPLIHLPYADLLAPDGTPRAAKEIWARLDKAGVSRYARIVLVGDDAGATAVGYYLLKLMGYADVTVQPA